MTLELAIKATLIVASALALMPLLRGRPAALRHWIIAAALGCAAIAPAVRLVVPSWHLPLGQVSGVESRRSIGAAPAVSTTVTAGGGGREVERRIPSAPVQWDARTAGMAAAAIWFAGAALAGVVLLLGLARLTRLARAARQVSDGVWVEHADRIRRSVGIRQPIRILQSEHSALLVTWGMVRPTILLPAGAARWGEDRVRVVLHHELAHVRRGDWLVQLAAELLRVIYWFNPVVWMACSRLRQESEQACDDAVLNHGVEGPEYASHLVAIARELHRPGMWVPAPSIVRVTSLERRIRAMLDTRINRRPVSRSACAAALLALCAVTIPVAGVAIAQGVFASVAGSIVDPTNGALPGVTLVLTNVQTDAKNEVRSDRSGRYEFVGLPAGDYLLEARLPGFAVLRGRLTLSGQSVQRDLKLEIGSLEETINVREKRGATPSGSSATGRGPAPARPVPQCGGAGSRDAAVGGNLRPPMKLLDVRPAYPASALAAGVQGAVVLQATIGTDGNVDTVDVLSTPHADLANAAVDAVRDWKFDATFLNCVPVPVSMKVTVNFQLEE